jgi:hypothetical protein
MNRIESLLAFFSCYRDIFEKFGHFDFFDFYNFNIAGPGQASVGFGFGSELTFNKITATSGFLSATLDSLSL